MVDYNNLEVGDIFEVEKENGDIEEREVIHIKKSDNGKIKKVRTEKVQQ